MLENRAMSGFPVSIGTGLALETVFDPIQDVYDESREVPDKVDINNYNLFIINISTLLRNILSSISSKDIESLKFKEVYDTLLEEIDFLSNFLDNLNVNKEFYVNRYKFIQNKYNKEKFRNPTTAKQMFISNLIEKCLDRIIKEDEVSEYDSFIKNKKEYNALIFTHIPFDLLSYTHFMNLELLESHTGIVKTRKNWNSKYYPIPKKDMSILPFFEYLLVTFGDHVMFHPDKLEKRLEVYEHIVKLRLHPLSKEMDFIKF